MQDVREQVEGLAVISLDADAAQGSGEAILGRKCEVDEA
jgi:hypothetical protein